MNIIELFRLFGSILVDNDEANRSIQATNTRAGATGETFSKLSKTVGSFGIAIGAAMVTASVAVGVFAFNSANKLDEATKTIRAGAGATGEALQDLRKDFDEVLKTVPATIEDVAIAIADLNTRTGQTGESLQELATAELELARLTGGDLATQIEKTTRLFGDWGIEGEKQVKTLDKLWNVSQTTGIGVDDLAQKMVQFGAPLRQMGFDFDKSAALMGKWEKEGVNTEVVLSSLRIALGKMAKEGITDTNSALLDMIDNIKNTGSIGEAVSMSMALFGAKAGPDMAAAIKEGRFELDGLMETLANSDETIGKATEETLKWGEKLDILKNRIYLVIEPLGNQLLGLLGQLIDDYLIPGVVWFESLNIETKETAFKLTGVVGVVGAVITAFGSFLIIAGAVIKGWGLVSAAVGGFVLPVTLAIIAVTAWGTAGYKLWTDWKDISDGFIIVMINMKVWTVNAITEMILGVQKLVFSFFNLVAKVSTIFPSISSAAKEMADKIAEQMKKTELTRLSYELEQATKQRKIFMEAGKRQDKEAKESGKVTKDLTEAIEKAKKEFENASEKVNKLKQNLSKFTGQNKKAANAVKETKDRLKELADEMNNNIRKTTNLGNAIVKALEGRYAKQRKVRMEKLFFM